MFWPGGLWVSTDELESLRVGKADKIVVRDVSSHWYLSLTHDTEVDMKGSSTSSNALC